MSLKKVACVTAVVSLAMAGTAFAGTWKAGDGENQNKWWYDNGNGSYPTNGWQWIDGNGDGVAESYYFDNSGWLLTNTTTPDGYTVNAEGAWVQNGTIQTKAVSQNQSIAPISENDFVVSGNNSVTQNNADHSIITNWIRVGYASDPTPYHAFVTGDSLTTARGISLGDFKSAVMEKYGTTESKAFNANADKWYQLMASAGYAETNTIVSSATVLEYATSPHGIRFNFNQQDQLIGVVFYRDTTTGNNSKSDDASASFDADPADYVGNYSYSGATSYIYNEQTRTYDVHAVTDNDSWEEWSGKIYPADPAYYNFTIKGASKEKYKIVDDGMTTYQFINVDGEWYYDVNADGEIDEAEMDKRDIESSYYYPEIIFLSDGRVAMQMEITLNYTEEDDVNTYYGWPAKGSLAINIFYTRK